MILGKTNIIFGLIILVLGIRLVSRHTGSQYGIAAVVVKKKQKQQLCFMSILKLVLMKTLDCPW